MGQLKEQHRPSALRGVGVAGCTCLSGRRSEWQAWTALLQWEWYWDLWSVLLAWKQARQQHAFHIWLLCWLIPNVPSKFTMFSTAAGCSAFTLAGHWVLSKKANSILGSKLCLCGSPSLCMLSHNGKLHKQKPLTGTWCSWFKSRLQKVVRNGSPALALLPWVQMGQQGTSKFKTNHKTHPQN